jgi:hypothetical protein
LHNGPDGTSICSPLFLPEIFTNLGQKKIFFTGTGSFPNAMIFLQSFNSYFVPECLSA